MKKSDFYQAVSEVLKELEYKFMNPAGVYYAIGPEIEMLTKAFPLLAEKLNLEESCKHEPPDSSIFIKKRDELDGFITLNESSLRELFSHYKKCKHCGVELQAQWSEKK